MIDQYRRHFTDLRPRPVPRLRVELEGKMEAKMEAKMGDAGEVVCGVGDGDGDGDEEGEDNAYTDGADVDVDVDADATGIDDGDEVAGRTIEEQCHCAVDVLVLETWPCYMRHHGNNALAPSESTLNHDRARTTAATTSTTTHHTPTQPQPQPQKQTTTHLACLTCFRLLPLPNFTQACTTQCPFVSKFRAQRASLPIADDTRQNYSALKLQLWKRERICIPCGVKAGRYRKGALLRFLVENGAGRGGGVDVGEGERVEGGRSTLR